MIRSRWFLLFIFGFATFSLVIGRAFLESRNYHRLGKESLSKGDIHMAITHFGRAAKWYFPGNAYVRLSQEGLWDAGTRAEKNEETDLALKAYFTLRGSMYGTRWLFMPHREWLEPCNNKIADLTVVRHPGLSKGSVLSNLHEQVGPETSWAALVVVGFLGWVGSTLGLIWWSFDSSGRMKGKKAVAWGGVMSAFFLLWVCSLLRA